jgi:hypothetical protein
LAIRLCIQKFRSWQLELSAKTTTFASSTRAFAQAIRTATDDYAELETGNREFFGTGRTASAD